jgi:signal transduction histidine kinase
LRNYSRHWAAKAAAFVLFVGCVTAFAITGLHFARGVREWNGKVSDYFFGRTFEESDFLFRKSRTQMDKVINAAGWYATSQEQADTLYQETHSYLEEQGEMLYYVRTPYRTSSNNTLEPQEYKWHTAWYLINGIGHEVSNTFATSRNNWRINYLVPHSIHRTAIGGVSTSPIPYDDYDEYGNGFYRNEDYGEEDYGAFIAQYEFRFALTNAYAATLATEYAAGERVFWNYARLLILCGLFGLLFFFFLLTVCGRKPISDGVHISVFDKPWLDVSLGAIIFSAAGIYWWFHEMSRYMLDFSDREFNLFLIYTGILFIPFTALVLWWLLSAAKRIKDRSFFRHTLVYAALALPGRLITRLFRAAVNGAPLTVQVGISAAGYGTAIFLFTAITSNTRNGGIILVTILIGIAITAYFIQKASHLAQVCKGLDRLAQGDYNTPVPENGRGALKQMAQNVNAATDGLKVAVEKEMTSQRFKAELITNVSHDLRTPLTSVITYADLLQNEGLTSPDAERYLDVIRQKAQRLQTLTEDLFEASKASSGETRAESAPLDIDQLIEQTLGEMGDRLSTAGLDVRVSGTCETVLADGRLLCRVFENLLRNIEKYALAGTRVYIDKASENGRAVITLRNISAAPLNGEADRLADRFTRGDEARSTEGSGLGLAIVKSFMELQKGTCAIAVDGDLFKVTLTLPLG